MSTIIIDFINCAVKGSGIGYFENDQLAVKCARSMGTNQRRKFERHGIVPAAFITYLKRKKAIQQDAWLPERKRNVLGLLDLLWAGPERRPGEFSEGEALREALLIELFPELKKAMGSSQHLWDPVGKAKRLVARGGTSKLPDYLEES